MRPSLSTSPCCHELRAPSCQAGAVEPALKLEEESEALATRRARLWEWSDRQHVPLQAILAAVGVIVAVYLLGRLVYVLRTEILLVVVASFAALLLNPAVVALQRTGRVALRRRGVAVALVVAAAVIVFAVVATLFGYPLVDAVGSFTKKLPAYVSQAEHGRGWIGHLVEKYNVQGWVRRNAPQLTDFTQKLAKPALTLGKAAVSMVVALSVIFMLVVLLLLEGQRLRAGAMRLMRPERAERVSRIASEVNRSVTGYMFGNFITSVIAGLVVGVALAILGVPYALLWALWVALVDFLPMIGGALAGIPTVLFAFTHSLAAGIVAAVVFVVYTQVENHVLNPLVMSRTVHVNPLLVLLAILVGASLGDVFGGSFGGFVGTLLAIPLAGSIQVVVREIWRTTGRAEGP